MNNGFIAAGERLLARAAHALEHHPKHVTAALAALLLCGGGGAFAVASLGPDPSALPVRQILETVQPLPLSAQASELDVQSLKLFRSEVTRSTDTVEALLTRLGVDDLAAANFLRTEPNYRSVVLGRAGRTVTVEATDSHKLEKLTVRWAPDDSGNFQRLVIEQAGTGRFAARVESAPLTASARLASGAIRTSLFAAADEARIPEGIATQLTDIFAGEIDFHRALRKNDRFNVVYEALEADGEPLRTGRILSAEFVNAGVSHQAMWFEEAGQKGGYYTLDGRSLRHSYLASPMEFSRVTSGFAMRFHPILQQWKAHLGVDYGAPTGTPVRTVGDGVVEFAGVQNGFGNVIIVRHSTSAETVYAHLSRINVRQGQKVAQGDHIGAVGATGWATGPHLHFEFRVNGIHQDPLLAAKENSSAPVSAAARPAFERLSHLMRTELAAASSATVASAR
ncbi:M23 family metallopeptidase [Caenimonas terrae]|uniref:M23 family metallopeptidase n=1 Tax=Caenimonas terrae TaxID=696074 RepID=A0ABW0NJ13_9BURK